MKITATQAQDLLTKYQDDLKFLQNLVDSKIALTQSDTQQLTLDKQVVPSILLALQSIVDEKNIPEGHANTNPEKALISYCFKGTSPVLETFIEKYAIDQRETRTKAGRFIRENLLKLPAELIPLLQSIKAEQEQEQEQGAKKQFGLVLAEVNKTGEAKDTADEPASEVADEVIEKAGDSKAAEAKPAPSNAAFYLECLSGLAMVAGGALCVAAMLTLKPLLLAAGMLLATIGTVGYLSTHRFFDSADSTKPTKPVAPESTVIEETADTAAAT
ncbi:MAG: hypothetical protein P1U61_09085, partial [Legionellaceae bacterium]|nr:hypothetical protein [Legionellaceae bacterium]